MLQREGEGTNTLTFTEVAPSVTKYVHSLPPSKMGEDRHKHKELSSSLPKMTQQPEALTFFPELIQTTDRVIVLDDEVVEE